MQRSYSVPVSEYKSSISWALPTSLALALLGLCPIFIMFFSAQDDSLRYMNHAGIWMLLSLPIIASIIIAASQIKVRGYQPVWERWTMIGLVTFNLILASFPVLSALLYGAGIGD